MGITYATPGQPFTTEALQGGPATYFPTGMVGTAGVRLEDGQGTVVVARSSAGIVEAGAAIYVATITAPASSGTYLVIWDDGAGHEAEGGTVVVTFSMTPGDDLTTLAAYKSALNISGTADDAKIAAAISAASAAITEYAQREFTPTNGATRTFPVRNGYVNLAPYDLRAASGVVISGQTLVADSDFAMSPAGAALGGTFLALELASAAYYAPDAFGRTLVTITGDWGMAAVPESIERACIEFARSLVQSDPGQWLAVDQGGVRPTFAAAAGTYSMPAAVRYRVDPYRRLVV